jgi:hypothetical protein
MAIDAELAQIVRGQGLVDRVVVTGGLPGCGKTMMTPIISSLGRVEVQKFNYAVEHLCALRWLNRIEDDAATALIRLLTDLDLYNLAMSREVNLRFTDLSSVFRNPGTMKYLRRLTQAGDAEAVARIGRERPILHLTVHNALAISRPLFDALGEALRIVEVVRHPLYMIKQWRLYVERYGADVRDFTLWFDYGGRSVPFFAYGWEATYLDSPPMDRAIYAIDHLLGKGREVLERADGPQALQVMVVPFERFVVNPHPYLRHMAELLGTEQTPATKRELARQRVPRTRIADGVAHSIYKQYGWEPSRDSDERAELARRREFAAAEASPEALHVLDRLSEEYEAHYLAGTGSW